MSEKQEDEPSLEEIEKELDDLRPKPPSPKTKHRIEEEEKKDEVSNDKKQHKVSADPVDVKSDNEDNNQHHKENELTPGKPDPTVNDNVKIPILNDHGEIELKSQQGSTLNRNKNNAQTTKKEETN